MGKFSNIMNILFTKRDIDKELLNYIKNLNSEDRKYFVFKTFFDNEDEQLMNSIEHIIAGSNFSYTYLGHKLLNMIARGKVYCEYKNGISFNRKKYDEVMRYYYSIIFKMSKLADELVFSNSMELSILFSYLMWNGYLSKNKCYNFDKYNRKNIYGLFFADIIDGIGVCLNHSEFLKDFLNYCGFSSTCLINFFSRKIKRDMVLNVERKFAHESDIAKFNIIEKENHVFNLIEDSGKHYVYDATNFMLINVIDSHCAEVINGTGKFKLFPYYSYSFCASKEEESVLDNLFISNEVDLLYSKEDFICMSNVCMEMIENCKSLLDDFYDAARSDIIGISKETDKIIIKRKMR